jgi:hypothetical protein
MNNDGRENVAEELSSTMTVRRDSTDSSACGRDVIAFHADNYD